MLVVPGIHTELARRAFSVAAPSTWNSTCWHSTVWKHSHFQTPLENPSIQTHLVLLCCIKRLCIFGPKGAIQIRYYYLLLLLHRGRFVVVHLYSTSYVDPQNFSIGANLYQLLWLFTIFEVVGPHFKIQDSEIWYEGAHLGLPFPSQFFYKNCLRGYIPFLGKFIPKITNFGDFGSYKPTF